MTEKQECYYCKGTGLQRDGIKTCNNCGGRGWKMEFVSEPSDEPQPEPLFFNFLTWTGVLAGAVMGGYFGWCVGGIGGALTYGGIAAVVMGFCAALFSAFLRILIKICIGVAILIAIVFLWGKGNPNSIDTKSKTTPSIQR